MTDRTQFGKRRAPRMVPYDGVSNRAQYEAECAHAAQAAAGWHPCAGGCGATVHKSAAPLLFNQGTGLKLVCEACYPRFYTVLVAPRGN